MNAQALEVLLSPWVLAALGLCIGSFLNVVIHRMPLMLERTWRRDSAEMLGVASPAEDPISLSTPRSRCPSCGHAIAWHENIPVLSFVRLGGKCSACKAPISVRYPLVEVLTAALFAAIAVRIGPSLPVLVWCGFAALLVALAGIDWDTTLLPDALTMPLLWAGLVCSALEWTVPLTSAVWGAVAGYVSLWSVYWVFKLATGKEGMGRGDFKLLSALGAWLGLSMVLPVVLGASVIGAIVGIAMKSTGQLREGVYVPFGPFLAGSGLAVMLLGQPRVLGWLGWA
jgi:leader peptidase (prepilin peptidase)/N-methyltransferase